MGLFKKNIFQNKKVSKARFLYLYFIFTCIGGLVYFSIAIFRGYPKHLALSSVYLLLGYLVLHFLYKNYKLIWFFIINVERGKLLLFLNKSTHWSESHKMKVANWTYPGRRRIRKEAYDIIAKKVMDNEELSKEEKKRFKHKVVFCPQQIKLGFNEALLVHALIHAHRSILPLDQELRDYMNLTDENMLKFNLMAEFDKAGGKEYNKYIEIGKRKSEELNKK